MEKDDSPAGTSVSDSNPRVLIRERSHSPIVVEPLTYRSSDEVSSEDNSERSGSRRYSLRRIVREMAGSRDGRAIQVLLSAIASRALNVDRELSSTSSDSDTDWMQSSSSGSSRDENETLQRQADNIRESDFFTLTSRHFGPSLSGQSLPRLLAKREIGCCGRTTNFTQGQTCQIGDRFLPNACKTLSKFKQKLFCGNFSEDGNIFVSACQDQNLRIYDSSKGGFRLKSTVRARNVGWSVLDTVLSPDKRHLIYSSWCDSIHQIEVNSDKEDFNHTALPLSANDESRFCIFSLRFSRDGDEILCGSNDGCLYLYDRLANAQTMRISAHEDDVNAVAFVDTPTHVVASGGDDGLCKIWDRRALRENQPVPVGTLAGHVDGITYIDPKGDGRYLITNSKDQTIKLWDLRRFSSNNAIEETKQAVSNQNWDYRWQSVPRTFFRRPQSNSEDSSVMTYRGHSVLQTLIRCHFSPVHTTGQKFIYSGSANGNIYIFDSLTGKVVKVLEKHNSCVRDVSWHPYMPEIISSSWDYTLKKWYFAEEIDDREDRQSQCVLHRDGKDAPKKRRFFAFDS